jgi:hypothetical protein
VGFLRFGQRTIAQQVQQHTGVPPIIRQQVQPAFMQAMRQSQQPWIMSQQALSPLVHVIMQPSFVISILHRPMVRLQVQTIMPFIMQHMVHMPPAIMVQRFCIMAHAVGSVQIQVIFMPPAHFSSFIVQRGTMTMLGAIGVAGVPIGVVPMPMPGMPPIVIGRSIIIVLVITNPPDESNLRGSFPLANTVLSFSRSPQIRKIPNKDR